MPLGIRLEQPAGILHRPVLADAGEHVLERPALGRVVEHVAEREHGHFVCAAAGDGDELRPKARRLSVAAIEAGGAEAAT